MSTSSQLSIDYFNQANTLYDSAMYSESLELYLKATKEDKSFYNAHFCVAKTYIRLKQFEKGLEYIKPYEPLLPKDKIVAYGLALSNILIEENQPEKALNFVDDIKGVFNDNETEKYLLLLLSNNKINKFYSKTIGRFNFKKSLSMQTAALLNKNVSKLTKETLEKDKVLSNYFQNLNKIKALEKLKLNDQVLKEFNIITKKDFEKEIINYHSFNDLNNEKILKLQNHLFDNAKDEKNKLNLNILSSTIEVLKKTNFDIKQIKVLTDIETEIKSRRKKKIFRKTLIIFSLVIGIVLVAYFAEGLYAKNKAYNLAISKATLGSYSSYLNEFGDNEEIHTLREKKLYVNAISLNTSESINELISTYPNSSFLREISVNSLSISKVDILGVNSDYEEINNSGNDKNYKVPYGCRVRLVSTLKNKQTIKKYFQISKNTSIKLNFIDEKVLVLHENFKNNNRNWDVGTSENKSYWGSSSIKTKLEIKDRAYYMENNNRNSFLYSTIYTGLKKSDDYEISMKFKLEQYKSNAIYLMFAAKSRAFLYFGYNEGKHSMGHNNWDDKRNSWVDWNGSWNHNDNSSYIAKLKVVKKHREIAYSINGVVQGRYDYIQYYGNRVGVGINRNTAVNVYNFKIYKYNKTPRLNFIKDQIYYCKASELNVRKEGNKTEIVAKLKQGEPIKYLGEHKEKKIKAYFFEEEINDYFYKIETKSGVIGWVHGGGINEFISSEKMNLEDFKFDLLNPKKEELIKETIISKKEIDSSKIITSIDTASQIKDTIQEIDSSKNETIKEEIIEVEKEEPKQSEKEIKTIKCSQCKGKRKTTLNCKKDGCHLGKIKASCSSCNGSYKSANDLCPKCDGLGCDYCDYDGQSCDVCTKGKTHTKHDLCNGTGKLKKTCTLCKGKGIITK